VIIEVCNLRPPAKPLSQQLDLLATGRDVHVLAGEGLAGPEKLGGIGFPVPVGPEIDRLTSDKHQALREVTELQEESLGMEVPELVHYRYATIRIRWRGKENAPFTAAICSRLIRPDSIASASSSREACFSRSRCSGSKWLGLAATTTLVAVSLGTVAQDAKGNGRRARGPSVLG
jgi:hypothetical protein